MEKEFAFLNGGNFSFGGEERKEMNCFISESLSFARSRYFHSEALAALVFEFIFDHDIFMPLDVYPSFASMIHTVTAGV